MLKTFSPKVILGAICLAALGFMLYSSWHESAIMDELAHIPAGYGYVRYLDYRLNPEHPPLVKALSALPLLAWNPHFPTDKSSWQNDVNGQWAMGSAFLYDSGNNANTILRVARLLPILLTVLLILLVYGVASETLGPRWALLPAFLAGLSPTVLAHGHYVTTDIGATFGILLTLWRTAVFFIRPSRKNLWYAGIALGIAELLKFSAVLLLPYVLFMAFAYWFARRNEHSILFYARNCFFIFLIAYVVVVYPVYALFTVHYPIAKQTADTVYTLGSFGGGAVSGTCHGTRCLAELDIALSRHYLTRPIAEYMLGVLMVMQRADGGNTAYFLGKVTNSGSHWYFPIVYALKETIPALIIVLLPFLLWALRALLRIRSTHTRFMSYLRDHFIEFSLAGFAVFYWVYSVKSPLNIGVRHILPTIPLMYILASSWWKRFLERPSVLRSSFFALLILWSAFETAIAAPHFLSYFNEMGQGPWGGYRYVLDSNYDWGQDLLALQTLVKNNPEMGRFAIVYFCGGDPSFYLGDRAVAWNSAKGDPRIQGIEWLAVSINSLEQATQPAAQDFIHKPQDQYLWLTERRASESGIGGVPLPDYRAGTSIFVYHL